MPQTLTTMIGSLPHREAKDALDLLEKYPLGIPAWPQLPKRSFKESMTVQYSEGFPGIIINEVDKNIRVGSGDALLNDMAQFYEHVIADNFAPFAITAEFAQGFTGFVEGLRRRGVKIPMVKGQVTGPFTYGLSLNDEDCRSVWFDEQYRDIVLKGLGAKACWQIQTLQPFADQVVIFFDEPIFSALGTPAYIGIQDEAVLAGLNELAGVVHGANARMGVHCCGNMDWSLLARSELDIIAFDAYSFGDKVALYPEAVSAFLQRGGTLAWGIVPTDSRENIEKESVDTLMLKIRNLEILFESKGIPGDLITRQRILTPSCGLGNLELTEAARVLELLGTLGVSCG